VPIETVIFKNIGLRGGVAPVCRYIPELLDDVLTGRINPGRVFDFEVSLDNVTASIPARSSSPRRPRRTRITAPPAYPACKECVPTQHPRR